MKKFYFFSLLLCWLSVSHIGFSQGNAPDYSRKYFSKATDTVYFDGAPYQYMDKKLRQYMAWSGFGHGLLLVGFGNTTQLVAPLFTRIPARRALDRFTSRLEGRPIYGLNAEKMNEFSVNLYLAKEEFRKIRNTNYLTLAIGLAGTATGMALLIDGIENSTGSGILPSGPNFVAGLLITAFVPVLSIQIPPILNRPRAARIQEYLYNARKIQEAPSLKIEN